MSNKGDISFEINGLELSVDDAIRKGVVIGDSFLTREQFGEWFEELVDELGEDNERLGLFAENLKKSIKTVQRKDKEPIARFQRNLDALHKEFVSFTAGYKNGMQGIGGDISLLTIFNFGENPDEEIYLLSKEEELDSTVTKKLGKKIFFNTKENLEQLITQVDKAVKLDNCFKFHLNQFSTQLNEALSEKSERQPLHVWSSYNMRRRYDVFHKEKGQDNSGVSLAQYFWGEGQIPGYVSEAFGTHLGLLHRDLTNIGENSPSVIDELGGKTSTYLYSVLGATKGNTSSQLSGDIVIIDENGNVKFNTQSKATVGSRYDIHITYQQFLTNVQNFIEVFQNWSKKSQSEKQKDLDTLFKKFSTTAFIDIKDKIPQALANEVKKQI